MNNPNNETHTEVVPAEVEQVEETSLESPAPVEQSDFQPLDLRRRLRELLSVPERDRSDEVWDEIIELEIQLAPGNRVAGGDNQSGQSRHNAPRHAKQGGGNPGGGGGGAAQQQKKHRPRVKNNRRPRQGGKPGAGGDQQA